ncbi:MAG TPA: DinB family protein [Chitinophaga sp.]|uniref:DinB family protein n=1 Tax=Chitinophaga sp. TaxID=1869181 RepID=UPI002D116162|nr:DinB family protein [Chitinophaga sp.]HVI48617.1 DinB family protein [Chitinophaga sp.]
MDTTAEIRAVAERLALLCREVPVKIREISDEDFHYKRPGKWSKKEILGHLIDSATNNHHRFVRARVEEQPPRVFYDPDDWVDVQQYQQEDRELVLLLWETYNRHLVLLINGMREEDLAKGCATKDGSGLLSLHFLVTDYLIHLEHHLKQIFGEAFRF